MRVSTDDDQKTGRIKAIQMEAASFEEERFLAMVFEVFETGNGKIEANNGLDILTWIPKSHWDDAGDA